MHCRRWRPPSGDREWWLPPPWGRPQLDAVDPLDPPEAAAAGSDQAGREAVPDRERGATGAGGEQQPVEVADRELDPVAGARVDMEAPGAAGVGDQRRDRHALPVLVGVPAAGAVEGRAQAGVVAGE